MIAAQSGTVTPREIVSMVSDLLACTKQRFGLAERRHTGGFHMVLYVEPKRQIWRVGDCQFRMGGRTFTNELEVEAIGARQRAVLIAAMQMRGMSDDAIMASNAYRDIFMPFFAPLLDFANRTDHPLGFGVMNGLPVPDSFIQVFDIPAGVTELVLTSDGYPQVFDTLAETEDHLAGLMQRDPMCISEFQTSKGLMPGLCSFDDRTYLRLRV